jgi:peroxiredoxin
LSEQRGKAVVVVFFDAVTADGPAEQKTFMAPFVDQPVVWIGITDDSDPAKSAAALEKYGIPWRVIWDGRQGPINTRWNVHSWPSVFVLDRQGVIRARNARGPELAKAVKAALAE